jgi:predicted nuclease of restriction endonuclease-like (RecB) superfamily
MNKTKNKNKNFVNTVNEIQKTGELYNNIAVIIEQARQKAATAVNLTMVYAYYEIGRYIVEDEQQGEQRAEYGKTVLKELSARLTERFGEGFSKKNLERMRYFYLLYSKQIATTLLSQFQIADNQSNTIYETVSHKSSQISKTLSAKFTLSWSHYLILMRVENPSARRFYEIEATQQQWSVRDLARQCASSLYERLALSRDKNEVMRLANEGQTIEKPQDILKNPLVLEFLGMEEKTYLLYNRLLQSYVLINFKTKKLKHKDLGQMQMYVNYYDRNIKQPYENPTIGILLCETANQTLVELTLPENANIYAAQYALYLPDKTLIQSKLKK